MVPGGWNFSICNNYYYKNARVIIYLRTLFKKVWISEIGVVRPLWIMETFNFIRMLIFCKTGQKCLKVHKLYNEEKILMYLDF